MRIAIPTEGEMLADHFGRCEKYTFYDIENKKLVDKYEKISPKHAPGVIPKFLKEEQVDIVITSGIGHKAIALFNQFDIEVITGCKGNVEKIIEDYLDGDLVTGDSTCDHEGDH